MTTAMPPVGPLTSTENLLPGDILRTISDFGEPLPPVGSVVTVRGLSKFREIYVSDVELVRHQSRFAFVARPGVWMPWSGGENPVPGMKVRVRGLMGQNESDVPAASEDFDWSADFRWVPIREYMVVTEKDGRTPHPGSLGQTTYPLRKGDPVEPPFGCQPLPQDTSARPEQKSAEPPVDARVAAADAVRAAAKALNDAMKEARREGVMTGLSVQEVVPRGQIVIVNCTTRV